MYSSEFYLLYPCYSQVWTLSKCSKTRHLSPNGHKSSFFVTPVIPSDALMFGYSDVERSRFYFSLAFQGLAGSFFGGGYILFCVLINYVSFNNWYRTTLFLNFYFTFPDRTRQHATNERWYWQLRTIPYLSLLPGATRYRLPACRP